VSFFVEEFDHIDFMKNVKNALILAKDQAGCRLLQKWLDQKDPYVTTLIFDQILPHFPELIIDPFGNYLCQKLAESCSYHQFIQLLQSISKTLKNICNNPFGTRAVQKLFEIINNDDKVSILTENLRNDVVSLVKVNFILIFSIFDNFLNYLIKNFFSIFY